jgi:hypothetical protein
MFNENQKIMKTMKTDNSIMTFEEKLEDQVNLEKIGIYEAFVNEGELRTYWGLSGDTESPMMKKVYLPVYHGEIVSLSFDRGMAIRNLLDAAGVDSLDELETIIIR